MRTDNYIAFMTICGFFIGLIFSVGSDISIEYFLFSVFGITLFFYALTLATASYILRFYDVNAGYVLHKDVIERKLDGFVSELEHREKILHEIHEFIEDLNESEDLRPIRMNKERKRAQ